MTNSAAIAEAEQDLADAKAAWRKALKLESYSISSGGTSRAAKRQNVETLYKQVQRCEQKLNQLKGCSGRIRYGIPA